MRRFTKFMAGVASVLASCGALTLGTGAASALDLDLDDDYLFILDQSLMDRPLDMTLSGLPVANSAGQLIMDQRGDGLLGPVQASVASRTEFLVGDDGLSVPTISTEASATFDISPGIAARISYLNRLNTGGVRDQNFLKGEVAIQTTCAGRFDVEGQMNLDTGEPRFKKLVWHIPRWGAC